MPDREMLYQTAILAGAVGLFVAAAAVATRAYSADEGLTPTGGIALVGAIVLFIVLLALAGVWLDRQEWDGEGA